jgi:hypothetical protein
MPISSAWISAGDPARAPAPASTRVSTASRIAQRSSAAGARAPGAAGHPGSVATSSLPVQATSALAPPRDSTDRKDTGALARKVSGRPLCGGASLSTVSR